LPLPERHVLLCTSDSCRKRGARKVCKALRKALAERGLKRRVQLVPVDCLKQCGHGPMALVYPDATWYAGLERDDVPRLVEEHLEGGKPLEARLYRRAHGKRGEG